MCTYVGWVIGTSSIKSRGYSKKSGSCPFADTTNGKISQSVRLLFHPNFRHSSVNSTDIGSPVTVPSMLR